MTTLHFHVVILQYVKNRSHNQNQVCQKWKKASPILGNLHSTEKHRRLMDGADTLGTILFRTKFFWTKDYGAYKANWNKLSGCMHEPTHLLEGWLVNVEWFLYREGFVEQFVTWLCFCFMPENHSNKIVSNYTPT